jgi:hypothetical protein
MSRCYLRANRVQGLTGDVEFFRKIEIPSRRNENMLVDSNTVALFREAGTSAFLNGDVTEAKWMKRSAQGKLFSDFRVFAVLRAVQSSLCVHYTARNMHYTQLTRLRAYARARIVLSALFSVLGYFKFLFETLQETLAKDNIHESISKMLDDYERVKIMKENFFQQENEIRERQLDIREERSRGAAIRIERLAKLTSNHEQLISSSKQVGLNVITEMSELSVNLLVLKTRCARLLLQHYADFFASATPTCSTIHEELRAAPYPNPNAPLRPATPFLSPTSSFSLDSSPPAEMLMQLPPQSDASPAPSNPASTPLQPQNDQRGSGNATLRRSRAVTIHNSTPTPQESLPLPVLTNPLQTVAQSATHASKEPFEFEARRWKSRGTKLILTIDPNERVFKIVEMNKSNVRTRSFDEIESVWRSIPKNKVKVNIRWKGDVIERFSFQTHAIRQAFYDLLCFVKYNTASNAFAIANAITGVPVAHTNMGVHLASEMSIFTSSFNCGNAIIAGDLSQWIPRTHDLYVISFQESESDDVFDKVQRHLGPNFLCLTTVTLLWIRAIVMVKLELWNFVSNLDKATVATGVGGVIGNKGAVAISLSVFETKLCFVGCHLAAREERVLDRNENYREILRGIKLCQPFDVMNCFHHLFWLGDLNYRVDLPRDAVMERIAQEDWSVSLLPSAVANACQVVSASIRSTFAGNETRQNVCWFQRAADRLWSDLSLQSWFANLLYG